MLDSDFLGFRYLYKEKEVLSKTIERVQEVEESILVDISLEIAEKSIEPTESMTIDQKEYVQNVEVMFSQK